MDRRKRRTADFQSIRALENPIAIRVLGVALKTPYQRPSALDVQTALADEFADLEIRQVAYHLARLRDAELLPRPFGGA